MSAKAKYDKIDRSKLNKSVLALLDKMKEKTDNFTNEAVIKEAKVEEALDKLIEKVPEAVKKPSASRTKKRKTATKKKTTPKTSGAKRETVMTVAKRIRKKDESWQDALKRAKSEMGKKTSKAKTQVQTELEKLQKMIKEDSVLKGFANSELQRDAVRKAKPRGKRKTSTKGETTNQYGTFKNKVGRTYWESRENRSDRYAPKYPKNKPFLEMGGDVTDAQDLTMANADFLVMAKGGKIYQVKDYDKFDKWYDENESLYGEYEKDEVRYENNGVYIRDDIYNGSDSLDKDNLYAKGGEIKDKKRYEIDEYSSQSSRTPENEYIERTNDFDELIEKITKRARDKKIPHIEIYYKDSYIGSLNERKNYRFDIGRGFLDNPLQSKKSYINNQVDKRYRMAKGGTLESKFDGYETMYKYALANNFTPRQLAEELRFMTNLQNKGDKELYDFLNNLSNMFPDTPISEFKKGGSIPQSAKDEFYQLRYDDEDFADQYGEDDLQEWYEEQGRFAKGGSIPQSAKDEFYQLRYDDEDFADQYGEDDLQEWYEEQGRFAKGGYLSDMYSGRYVILANMGKNKEPYFITSTNFKDSIKKNVEYAEGFVKEKFGKNLDVFVVDKEQDELTYPYYKVYPKSLYAKGGRLKSALMRDRKYYNKNEAWERAYNKGKNRRGYKENGGTIENSIQSYQNHYKGFPSYEDGGTIANSTQHFRIMETDTPIYKEGGQIDMDL